ncbi:MAG: phospholipase D-like domain-containing protein [Pseudomonadota bacterium]
MQLLARPMPLPVGPKQPADAAVKRLFNVHHACLENCRSIRAAIAYGSRNNMEILTTAFARGTPVEFYGRYDGSCAVDPEILRWFLEKRSAAYEYRLVPKWLHAKVIWWVGSGVYIGSANLTDRAWNSNFEAGLFLEEDELEHFGILDEINAFFEGLRANSHPLTEERYQSQLALWKQREKLQADLKAIEDSFDQADALVNGTESPIAVNPGKTSASRFKRFDSEWQATLQIMRDISRRVVEHRPTWIAEDVPSGVQADQFLHAYYYQRVRPGSEKDAHERFFARHERDPEAALKEGLLWWQTGDYEFEQEHRTIHDWAPLLREYLSKDRVLGLTEEEWVEAATRVHALADHASKVSNRLLGLPETQQSHLVKSTEFAHWLWLQRTKGGKSILEVIDYVVWGSGDLTRRLWDGCHEPVWKMPHIKTSILGEIIGWANPERFPPRNMRTSKGLRALGYRVDVNI